MLSEEQDSRKAAYERVCESYHAIDDFRMKLLGLLPVATGTGVFLLLNSNTDLLDPGGQSSQHQTLEVFLTASGLIGLTFTVGLFAYELFGIKRCHYLIQTGKRLEIVLKVHGQFRNRPRNLMGFINEPFATALIYPASMAAWAFLAVAYHPGRLRWALPAVVFIIGMAITLVTATGIVRRDKLRFLREVRDAVDHHPTMTVASISQSIHAEEEAVRQALGKPVPPRPDSVDGRVNRLLRVTATLANRFRRKGKLVTVSADDSGSLAFCTMKEHRSHWLPVTREDQITHEDQIIGTVGKADAEKGREKKVGDLLP